MPAGDLGFHRKGVCNLDLSFDVIPDHIKDCSLNGGAGLLQLAISLDANVHAELQAPPKVKRQQM